MSGGKESIGGIPQPAAPSAHPRADQESAKRPAAQSAQAARQKGARPQALIHDHFDGSAHCAECGGPCSLAGAARALTEMVRWRLEQRPWLNLLERHTLEQAGADPDALIKRAREALR